MASMVAFAQSLAATFQHARTLFGDAGRKATSPNGVKSASHVPPPVYFQETATGFGYLVEGLKSMETQLIAMGDIIGKDLSTGGLLSTASHDFRAANTAAKGTGFFVSWNGPPASYYKKMAGGLQNLAAALQAIDSQIRVIRPELERAVQTANTVPGYDPTFWQRNTAVLNNNTFSVPTSVVAQKKL